MTLTFRELLESFQTFSDDDLGVSHVGVSTSLDDALDKGHPFLQLQQEKVLS